MSAFSLLINEPRPFYSYLDEKAFFDWLNEVDAITDVTREGVKLKLTIDGQIDDASFRDLISLLRRYSIDMKPLKKLMSKNNVEWLKDSQAYWYQLMYV